MDNELVFPLFWKTRYDIIGFDPEADVLAECEGPGNCHGCLAWCAYCGDVKDVCHVFAWPDRCDQHERYPVRPPGLDPRQLVLFAE